MYVGESDHEKLSPILRNVTTLTKFVFLVKKASPDRNNHTQMQVDLEDDLVTEDDDSDDENDIIIYPMLNANSQSRVYNSYINIKNLLKQQTRLHTLEINHGKFFDTPFNDCQFTLKKIVLFIPRANETQLEHMRDFLLLQNRIETCVFNILTDDKSSTLIESFDHILRMGTMKDLKIVFYDSTSMNSHYRNFKQVNPSVEKLYLSLRRFDHNYRRFVETTCKNFPNVKELNLKLDPNWLFEATARTFEPLTELKHLEHITFDHVRTEMLSSIRIPKLKRLTCLSIMDSNQAEWRQFFQNNPTIEEIHVQFVSLMAGALLSSRAFIEEVAKTLPRIKKVVTCGAGNRHIDDNDIDLIVQAMAKVESFCNIRLCGFEFFKYNKGNGESEVYLQVDKAEPKLHSKFSTLYLF